MATTLISQARMRTEDFDRIERQLGVRLPESYRRALQEYPLPVDAGSTSLWLVDNPDGIIGTTRSWREGLPNGRLWPASYVYIGCDGGDYMYFLDVGRQSAPVLRYDHETGTVDREEAPDLPSYIEQCRREYETIEADVRETSERYRTRKWWQFWIRPYSSRDAP